jgi:hypothetical protein
MIYGTRPYGDTPYGETMKQYVLTAGTGAFTLSGVSARLLYNRVLHALPGSFAVTGNAVRLLFNRLLRAATGVFLVNGLDVRFEIWRKNEARAVPVEAASRTIEADGSGRTIYVKPDEREADASANERTV